MSQDNFTNDEWYTPPDLMVKVRKILGNDFLDPASSVIAAPHIKASRYFTRVDNGLNQQWEGKVWLNPPYSKPLCSEFIGKLIRHYLSDDVIEALVLVNNRSDTVWFNRLALVSTLRLDFRGRLRFWTPGQKNDSPRHGSTLFYLTPQTGNDSFVINRFCEVFSKDGIVWHKYE